MDIDRKLSPPQDQSVEDMFKKLQLFARSFYEYEIADLDDPFLRAVMERSTRPLAGFEVDNESYRRYKELSQSEERDYDDYFDLGVDIGSDILDIAKNDRDKILFFMNAYNSMNFIQTAITIHDKIEPEMVHSRVAQFVGATILDSVEDMEKFRHLVFRIMDTIEGLEHKYEDATLSQLIMSYHNALVVLLGHGLNREVQQGHARAGIIGEYDATSTNTESEHEVARLCSLLTKEAMSHRKYGTKPAYIEASIGGSWLFYDGEEYKAQMSLAPDSSSNIAAVVLHSPKSKFEDLSIKPDYFEATNDALGLVGGAGEKNDFIIYITHDGELTTDQFGLNTLERTFRDNIVGAQKMKAEIASNFYDLSMPVYKQASEPRNFPGLTSEEKENFDPIQQLLIPRVRLLDKMPSQDSDITRTVREHDVTWFVRLLPSGFHASPEAVAAAARHGIVLEENETFVKSHKRGTISEKVLGYHAIRR